MADGRDMEGEGGEGGRSAPAGNARLHGGGKKGHGGSSRTHLRDWTNLPTPEMATLALGYVMISSGAEFHKVKQTGNPTRHRGRTTDGPVEARILTPD